MGDNLSEEKDNSFSIGNKAEDLMEYTFAITSNRKRYPNKYKTLIERIQVLSMDIFETVLNANDINLKTDYQLRYRTQTKAVHMCDRLSKFVDMSMNLKLIGSDTVKSWQKLICDVKYMTISWRTKDSKR